jgi:hypothetical protein
MEFLAGLRAGEFERAACGAMIVGRPDPQLGDQAFRVRLDAGVPFKLADPANQKSERSEGSRQRTQSELGSVPAAPRHNRRREADFAIATSLRKTRRHFMRNIKVRNGTESGARG